MKKYQLKYNNGTELIIWAESDRIYDILKYIREHSVRRSLKFLSIWMDGKVLE